MSQPVWKSLPTKPARLYPKKYHDTALTKARLRKDAERLDRNAIHLARTAHGPYFPEQVHAFIPEELAKYRRVFDEATRESFPEEVRLNNELTNAQAEEVWQAQAAAKTRERIQILDGAAALRIPLPTGMNPFTAEGRMHLERGAQEMYRRRFDELQERLRQEQRQPEQQQASQQPRQPRQPQQPPPQQQHGAHDMQQLERELNTAIQQALDRVRGGEGAAEVLDALQQYVRGRQDIPVQYREAAVNGAVNEF
jgi:hypothetical protein